MTAINDALQQFLDTLTTYQQQVQELLHKNEQCDTSTCLPKFWTKHKDFTTARQVWLAAAGSIAHEVTKFSLVYKQNPSDTEAKSVCAAMLKPVEQLFTAMKVAIFCGTGGALTQELLSSTMRVLKGLFILATALKKRESSKVPSLTGQIWEDCKGMQKVSASNQIATKRCLLESIVMIKDTIEEFNEAVESSKTEGIDADKQEDLTTVEAEGFDFDFDVKLDQDEQQRISQFIKLLSMLIAIAKKGTSTLALIDSDSDGNVDEAILLWTKQIPYLYKSVHAVIVDMSPGFYPPHDTTEIRDLLSKFSEATIGCLDHLLEFPALVNATELQTGKDNFLGNVRVLESML